ncbi:OsmC family protein [Botryobacter ruber]|uniref:OsmC family protein n=1 Tax=Botryobacter ruber TaxID=2171629 RepID=UPI0013E3C014|nr:OsmC family protein [Botryobacter ruber]
MSGTVIVSADSTAGYVANIEAANQHLVIDESDLEQGEKNGPDPFDYIMSSLGACTVVTLHMYAKRKNWPLERAEVRMQHQVVNVEDPELPNVKEKRMQITKELILTGDLSPEQRERLEYISGRCPVQRVLESGVVVKTVLADSPAA